MRQSGNPTGIAIVKALDDREAFRCSPVQTTYDHDTKSERVARRYASWTPVGPECVT